jgi:REP element-mobilizing transposase RayT
MYNPETHHRRSIRLREYDYAGAGAYFVTMCAFQRECLFGEVVNGTMRLNEIGNVVGEWWEQVTSHFAGVSLDQYVIMPNHFHGIVVTVGAGFPRPFTTDIGGNVGAGFPRPDAGAIAGEAPEKMRGETPPLQCPTLGQIIGYFKYQSTKRINEMRDNAGCPVWQRNYYEHIIRNEDDLTNVRRYIAENPLKWDLDENNPANFGIRP